MSRRSFISMSQINRLFSSLNRKKREENNYALINSQRNIEKEQPPQFNLIKVDFNMNTRVTHIEILQSQQYRTIQRYVTQNYQKYPVYSNWKTKEKTIKKTLKLTNSELELLNINDDDLIRMFAEEIIIKLNNEELFPSWFIRSYLKKEMQSNLEIAKNNYNSCKDEKNKLIKKQQSYINDYNEYIDDYRDILIKKHKKEKKLTTKLVKIHNSKKNLLKTIFSFGIYYYMISSKRKNKIELKLSKLEDEINTLDEKIKEIKNKIENCNKRINDFKIEIKNKEIDYNKIKKDLEDDYNKKVAEVEPLSTTIAHDKTFRDLKMFSGLKYEKIIGVYVIHNKENDKYYVGQSKDVMKRIRQHFNGTTPKNVIFAEDYFMSPKENRDNIFEFKIIKCETKDELDYLEKKLIYEYNSWNNGYNGTSGNI